MILWSRLIGSLLMQAGSITILFLKFGVVIFGTWDNHCGNQVGKTSQAKAWVSPQSGERNWEAGLRMKNGLHGSEEYDVLGGRRNCTNRIRACTPFAHREQSGRRANLTALSGFPVFRSNSLDILIFLQSPCLFKIDGPAVRQHQSNKHTINSCRTTG